MHDTLLEHAVEKKRLEMQHGMQPDCGLAYS